MRSPPAQNPLVLPNSHAVLPIPSDAADRNWRRFVLFRVLFNSRFYYPVLAVLFLDLGLSCDRNTRC